MYNLSSFSLNNIDNNVIPHPNTIPSGAGVVQGRIYMKLFIPKISTNALNIHTFKIGATINGRKLDLRSMVHQIRLVH